VQVRIDWRERGKARETGVRRPAGACFGLGI